jgi:acyl dehydratase
VCGFTLVGELPPTYPHILAFPLQLELMTDRRFPFPVLGVVHIANRITQHRPVPVGEPLDLRVHATPLEPHPKGRQFALVTEARVDGELVWEERSTNLRRGAGASADATRPGPAHPGELPAQAHWSVPGDIGRRYAGVSGDRNPIHLHDLTAKAFGFPRAIAHGMWTKARALGALRLPDTFTADVAFARPVLLPARVVLATEGNGFAVRAERDGTPHLNGEIS